MMNTKAKSDTAKIADLSDFDPAQYMDSPQAIAEYLTAMMEDGDPGALAAALGDIAKARGMAEIASASGLTREALYKALRSEAQPRLETIIESVAPWVSSW